MDSSSVAGPSITKDLCRLARFGANISDAYSCFILLPWSLLNPTSNAASGHLLELGGYHSLSTEVFEGCQIPSGSGLIGWVAKHERSIHVSPFEQDSRTLGVYLTDQELKSFIGIPVPLKAHFPALGDRVTTGVIACDSKKSFAFSKLQGKLLDNLAAEVANTIKLQLMSQKASRYEPTWGSFIARADLLATELGLNTLDVLRLRPTNFNLVEARIGTGEAIGLVEQVYRLIEQALPPHFPALELPNGDILLVVDHMVTGFYENKIRALSNHINVSGCTLNFEFDRFSARDRRGRVTSVAELVPMPSDLAQTKAAQGGI